MSTSGELRGSGTLVLVVIVTSAGKRPLRLAAERGFTLIELMVIVLIIAVLLAISVAVFLGAKERAADTAAKSRVIDALKAQRVIYTDAQAYGEGTAVELVEPSIETDSDAVVAGKVFVKVEGDIVTLAARSTSGRCFWVRDSAGVASYAKADCDEPVESLQFGAGW